MTSNDLKRGLVFLLDNSLCLVLDLSSQSPSARGGSTLIKTKYRNLLTGQVLEKTFKAGERVDDADFEKRKGQFLYADGDNGVDNAVGQAGKYVLEEEFAGHKWVFGNSNKRRHFPVEGMAAFMFCSL